MLVKGSFPYALGHTSWVVSFTVEFGETFF